MPVTRLASPGRILAASLVGTTIEFYDFYIYGTAAALVLGPVFFPAGARVSQTLGAFLSFAIAFVARPFGAVLFGHFGDRFGRKSTLVASLLVMGTCTSLIGVLPSFATAGVLAPVLLCVMRLGQGIGLGGEWGGAALLATENAPAGRRAWFGMFPQLGPPFGFLLSNGLFLLLFLLMSDAQFAAWGWRIPFIASAVLVGIGLYVRVTLGETAAFAELESRHIRARVPVREVLRAHWRPLLLGSFAMVMCYALFYIVTVFSLGYGTRVQHIPRDVFLGLLCVAIVAMAAVSPISAVLADRFGRRPVLLWGAVLTGLFAFALPPLLGSGGIAGVLLFLVAGLALMGATFAPMGALLPELFPTRVRYTGAALAYSIGGILGGSLSPYIAVRLLDYGGLRWVGYYVTAGAVVSFAALLCMRETQGQDLAVN